MVKKELIKELLTRLKEDAKAGCELKSSDFFGKDTLNVDAAHDAILYCQPHKHNDDTIFEDDHYDSSKKNGNYPGTSRHKSECVSKLEENVCYIRDSFSGVALKGYNNYLDSAGTPKIQEWHKYHFGNTIKTGQEIGSVDLGVITKNKDLLEKIQTHSKFLNYDNFIHKEYELAGGRNDISDFNAHCILGLNFTWQAVLYYGYCQFLENEKNCTFDTKVNGKKIIECLRQINFVELEDSVPKWKIGHPTSNNTMFDAFNVSSDDTAWNSMIKTKSVDGGPYYFITSQSFVHSQISKLLNDNEGEPGFESRNEGDEDSSGIGEVQMEEGMKKLFTNSMGNPAKRMLWQFLKFQGDSSHLVFYSIIKVASDKDNKNISIKVLTGERPLVKRAQLEGKTIVVRRFNVFNKYWPEAGSSDGVYIEFVADAEAQTKTLLAKAVSLKQSEYYENWGDNLDSEIMKLNNNLKSSDEVEKLKEKMKKFGKYIIEQKIQTYIGGDFKNDAEKFFKLMRPAKGEILKPVRGAGGKQFDFGKDVDVVFSKLGFLADNYDTLDDDTTNLLTIKEMMNGIEIGRRPPVSWVDHLQYIVKSFKTHEQVDAAQDDVNYKVLVLNSDTINLEIDIKGLTTFVSMNYYVMNDRSIFSSSSDSYQKVFFFAKILKFFIKEGIKEGNIKLPRKEEYFSVGGAQIGGTKDYIQRRIDLRENLQKIYETNITTTSELYKCVLHCFIRISDEIDNGFNYGTNTEISVSYTGDRKGFSGVGNYINTSEFKFWEESYRGSLNNMKRWVGSHKFTKDTAQVEKALFKKFLDTVPHNIELADLPKFHAKEPKKESEMDIPEYDRNYPYTIWWLYSYINKGGGYEDFTDLFNSKITDDTNKYFFVNETKFMEWKEKILSHEYNACIRYKYDYFLNGGVFQDYVFTTPAAAAAAAAADAAATAATAANTENEFKIFTELEIKHLIVSTISLSGRFSDDNAILEDMEIVNVIQKELNKKVYGDSQEEINKKLLIVADVNEDKDDNDKVDVKFVKHYTEEEVVNLKFKNAAKNGKVIDLTTIDDVSAKGGAAAAAALRNFLKRGPATAAAPDVVKDKKPQKTIQQLEEGDTKEQIKSTLGEIVKKVFKGDFLILLTRLTNLVTVPKK